MTFKDLKKRVTIETAQQSRLFERLQNKPFGFGMLININSRISKLMGIAALITLSVYHKRMDRISHYMTTSNSYSIPWLVTLQASTFG